MIITLDMTSFLSVRLCFIKHNLFLHHEKWNKGYKLEKMYGGGMGESKGDKSEQFTCLMAKLTTIIAQDIIANRQFRKTLISKWLVILGYNSIP